MSAGKAMASVGARVPGTGSAQVGSVELRRRPQGDNGQMPSPSDETHHEANRLWAVPRHRSLR